MSAHSAALLSVAVSLVCAAGLYGAGWYIWLGEYQWGRGDFVDAIETSIVVGSVAVMIGGLTGLATFAFLRGAEWRDTIRFVFAGVIALVIALAVGLTSTFLGVAIVVYGASIGVRLGGMIEVALFSVVPLCLGLTAGAWVLVKLTRRFSWCS